MSQDPLFESYTKVDVPEQDPPESDRAAQLCDALTYSVYEDWFLPSNIELYEICWVLHSRRWYEDATEDHYAYGTDRVCGFASDYYWSSSESSSNHAWRQYFYDGYQGSFNKDYYYRVRAIRAF